MHSPARHCPHCGQSLRRRDVQCDACLRSVARRIPRRALEPALACALVLIAGVAEMLWHMSAGFLR